MKLNKYRKIDIRYDVRSVYRTSSRAIATLIDLATKPNDDGRALGDHDRAWDDNGEAFCRSATGVRVQIQMSVVNTYGRVGLIIGNRTSIMMMTMLMLGMMLFVTLQ